MRKTLAATALLVITTTTLAACGQNPDDAPGGTSSSSAFDDADVTFAQQMIPHHEQAVEMAQLAPGRAGSAEVLELAEAIEAAQGPEIEALHGWLGAWGEDMPSGGPGGMDHGDMGDDPGGATAGMMDEEEMQELMAASGPDWDRMFLEMMIEHHEGAVEMAQIQVEQGTNPDAVAMAEKVIRDQQAEIVRMRELLER